MEEDKGLMKITPPPRILANRQTINQQSWTPGFLGTIFPPTSFKHAVIVLHGDGDQQIEVRVLIGTTQFNVRGDRVDVLTVANNTVQILVVNNDSNTPRTTPRIEILSLDWV
jgi:hypothetical protein